ncbi:hypothetical protein X907_2101 [Glycocaulis alkaliphilus]|uniref:Uncharacterized protein n=1 Tax=Glycocaulis alkaliphilus TaxID=1434191 RepID=A0A3T0EBC3_9PROT|nr:hypothetical protein [Glycocaulis alkaliphilus]AZU04624.1 hypothetical protein X907_2101 [Glycocaulis alkaliphilus]GGB69001.1 hypothetical protein GCM10007417_06010 [Glycocaulis alkaliphilus]
MITPLLAILSVSLLHTGVQEVAENADESAVPNPVLVLESAPQTSALRLHADTYAAYHSDVSEAGARELTSVMALDETMDSLAAYYTDDRLVDAQIAYAALVAAQHPEFIDSVRAIADYYGSGITAASLMNDPVFVTGFMGADTASDNVVGALTTDTRTMNIVADRYREAAYDLQSQTWARTRAQDRRTRLEQIESGSVRLQTPFRMAENGNGRRLGAASDLFGASANAPRPEAPVPGLALTVGETQLQPDERRVGRILAVAALQSIESGDMRAMDALLADPAVGRCIVSARLNLAQCVAAGHFKYEDAFCIAEHALQEVAVCLTTTRAPVAE